MSWLSNGNPPPWRLPQGPSRVRPELRPIGGIVPHLTGKADFVTNAPFTVGSGIAVKGSKRHESPIILNTPGSGTGLTRATSYTGHPFTFIWAGRVTALNAGYLGSIATAADKLVRVQMTGDGKFFAQHLGATTNATATTAQTWFFNSWATVVACFRSPTDVEIFSVGEFARARAQSTTDVGALGTLDKLAIATYDGSVNISPADTDTAIALWLRYSPTTQQAWDWCDNPALLLEAAEEPRIWVPVGAVTTTIDAGIGAAAAQGYQAGVAAHTVVAAGVGAGASAGAAVAIATRTSIACSVGAAAAAGHSATITIGNGTTISGNVANATAQGLQAGISLRTVIGAGVGAAGALGYDVDLTVTSGAGAADVWNYVLSNGKTAEETAVEIHSMLTTLVGGGLVLPVNVKQVNDRVIRGTGVPGDTWGPA